MMLTDHLTAVSAEELSEQLGVVIKQKELLIVGLASPSLSDISTTGAKSARKSVIIWSIDAGLAFLLAFLCGLAYYRKKKQAKSNASAVQAVGIQMDPPELGKVSVKSEAELGI